MTEYLGILFLLLIGIGLGCLPVIISKILAVRIPDQSKDGPYECGFEEIGSVPAYFDIRYYLIAIVFILFDIEIAFLFPWALSMRQLGFTGFVEVFIFLAELVLIMCYLFRKGALDWD